MAFDKTNSAHLLALKTEEATDPIGMGYKKMVKPSGTPPRFDGDIRELLRRFNEPALNVGGESIKRPTAELDIPSIAGAINPAEFNALTVYDKEWVKMFINRPAEEQLKPYQAKFVSIFPAGSTTLTAVLRLRARPASRVEVMFGVNTRITTDDWFTAEASNG